MGRLARELEADSGVDSRVARAWIDALSEGTCDEAAFLQALPTFTRETPEVGWSLLSLIDQYYRRGRIASASFQRIKANLERRLMRPGFDDGVSVPLPRSGHTASTANRTVPILAPVATAPAGVPPVAPQAVAPPAATPPAPTPPLATAARQRRIATGDLLAGRYLIKGLLGRGGMGTVFEAVDNHQPTLTDGAVHVAIKVLHGAVGARPDPHGELRREFEHLQALSHPNIVRVHEFGRDGEIAFFTMELLKGRSLARTLAGPERERPLRAEVLTIVRGVGAALAFAHARGIVHGDLNPGNVFITDDGEVRVLDFGSSLRSRVEPRTAPLEAQMRQSTATPRYASCEVLEGAEAQAPDDVYACACILYLLLTGAHPFGERTALEARSAALTPVRPQDIDQDQWRALLDGLSFERAARPRDVQTWLAPFTADRAPGTPRAKRRGRMPAAIAAMIAAATIGGWLISRNGSVTDSGHPLERAPIASAEASAPEAQTAPAADAPAPALASTAQPAADSLRADPPAADPPAPATVAPTTASAAATPAVTTPRSRIELAAGMLEVSAGSPAARVLVRRTGGLQSEARFSWWTESGTAKPGQDFEAITAHDERFERGTSTLNLYIPIIADSTRQQPKNFYVMIGDPSDGASLGARTLMMVTIAAEP